VLGSTGSIGTQTLDIIEEFPDKFKLVALAAGSNIELLAQQVIFWCTAWAPILAVMSMWFHPGELRTRRAAAAAVAVAAAKQWCKAYSGGPMLWPDPELLCCAALCAAVCCAALRCAVLLQIRKFKPKMVAIRDAGKVKQLQELIKDVEQQPDILVGDEGAVEVSTLLLLLLLVVVVVLGGLGCGVYSCWLGCRLLGQQGQSWAAGQQRYAVSGGVAWQSGAWQQQWQGGEAATWAVVLWQAVAREGTGRA
jgi:1-deoxy-D-xylulose 5-phosphate reductoisomerase